MALVQKIQYESCNNILNLSKLVNITLIIIIIIITDSSVATISFRKNI